MRGAGPRVGGAISGRVRECEREGAELDSQVLALSRKEPPQPGGRQWLTNGEACQGVAQTLSYWPARLPAPRRPRAT